MASILNIKNSYITPIILSYVDKYIKNIRLEDTKVSLWSGEAVFHNLSLRLDVLEEELALPFSFVSGQIHELAINVPWTKLHAEPITVTINTIECVLKLKSDSSGNQDAASTSSKGSRDSRKKAKRSEVESPPSYMQSLVNRIVSNVVVRCNNVILKYVEDDLVLSLNARSLLLQSANAQWQPAFTELSVGQLMLRKLVTLQDLTVCLDRRNASGQIEAYEEPLVFQCSVELRVSRTYAGLAASRATSMRMDVHCGCINFSVSDQQVPMLLRVLRLGLALYLGELKNDTRNNRAAGTTDDNPDENAEDSDNSSDSWVGWAWSMVPSILPNLLEEEEEGEGESLQPSSTPYTLQLGFFVDQLRFVFKASESTLDRTCYGLKNVKFHPLTVLEVYGCYLTSVLIGIKSVAVTAGASLLLLSPTGEACACGGKDTQTESHFLVMGEKCSNYSRKSYFDPECDSFEPPKSVTWEEHLNNTTEAVLLDKTPGFAMDYLYMLHIPDNMNPDNLSELESEIESGNLVERALCRFVVGPFQAHVCSGLIHRAQLLLKAARMYNYPPYNEPVAEPCLSDLPPSTEEALNVLESNMPLRAYQLTVFKPVVHVYLANHPDCEANERKRKKKVCVPVSSLSLLPHVSIDCQCLDATFVKPMYPLRHVPVVSQQASVSEVLLNKCHQRCNIRLLGLGCHLNVRQQPMTILVPSHVSLHLEQLIFPQLWQRQLSMSVMECSLEAETLTLTLTKAQALLMEEIGISCFQNVLESNYEKFCTQEATKNMPLLELNFEGLKWKMVQSASTIAHQVTLQAVKMFALQQSATTVEQVLVLSSADNAEEQVLSATLQYQNSQSHPVLPNLLLVKLNKIDICADPLILEWLTFSVFVDTVRSKPSGSQSSLSEVATSVSRQIRRSASFESRSRSTTAPQESVHSYEVPVALTPEPVPGVEIIPWKTKFLQLFTAWRCALACIDIAPCNIHIPSQSLSSLGAQSIEETLKTGFTDVLGVYLPSISLKSNNLVRGLDLAKCGLPLALLSNLWDANKEAFPCSLTLGSLSCNTRINGIKRAFLHLPSASCTIGITSNVEREVVTAASLCVHIDTPSMNLGMCCHQMPLVLSVVENLHTVFMSKQQQAQSPQETASQWDTLEQFAAQATTPPPTISAPSIQQPPVSMSVNEPWPSSEGEGEDTVKLSAWLQWTMARLVMSLFSDGCCSRTQPSPQLKLTCEVEEVMTSIDVQQVYLKVKTKVATASVQHFYRPSKYSEWYRGPHMGLLVHCTDEPPCPLEDIAAPRPSRPSGTHSFLDITFTRALSDNVHQRWAQQLSSYNLGAGNTPVATITSQKPRFISEVVVKLCPLDIVLPASVLAGFLPVFQPLLSRSSSASSAPWQVNNNTLALLYLDTRAIRVFLPLSAARDAGPDLCIVHLQSLRIRPHAENPLSRVHVRSELYYLAQQANILNVPGSLVEDRQYQLDVCKLTVHTGAWHQVEAMFQSNNREGGEQNPLSENPAVEWNKLALNKQSFSGPNVPLLALVNTVNVSLMFAPAIVYQVSEHLDILVCGHSAELNATSDIEISISAEQLASVSLLLSNWLHFTSALTQLLNVEATASPLPDSGIDDQSSVCSPLFRPLPATPVPQIIPSEVLLTANKIILTLYSMRQQPRSFRNRPNEEEIPSELSYDASEDSSVENVAQSDLLVIHPLLYAAFLQPHIVLDCQSMKERVEVSCFDMALRTSSDSFAVHNSSTRLVPKLESFTVCILETKGGDPHPKTGIPPSLLTATWSNFLSNTGGELLVQLGRPVQVHANPTVWSSVKQVEALLRKFVQPLQHSRPAAPQSQSDLLRRLRDISCGTLKTCQIMLNLSHSSQREQIILSVAGISGSFSSKSSIWSEKGTFRNQFHVDSLLLKVVHEERPRILLKPCSFKCETVLSWDPWVPSVQTSLNFDLVHLEVGPDQVECVTSICQLLQPYLQQEASCELTRDMPTSPGTQDEHYQDDLRAGAFQFLEVNALCELPQPYQVVFYQNPPAMAWRYPQPRALTSVDVLPVPFVSAGIATDDGVCVKCVLQYWSPCEGQYVSYCEFDLSESHRCKINLPSITDKNRVVTSSCWQVLMHPQSSLEHQHTGLSPRTLAACMRIDSFFSTSLVPQLQVALDVTCLRIDLTCQTAHLAHRLPEPLSKYTPDGHLPDLLPMAMLEVSEASLYISRLACGTMFNKFEATLLCDIVDMATLTTLRMLHPFRAGGTVTLSQSANKQPTADIVANAGCIRLRFGPTAAHTLATVMHIWQRTLAQTEEHVLDVLPTHYVVCNDSSSDIRLGQCGTPERIVVKSGQYHMYAWYSPILRQLLQISLAQDEWDWSLPLSLKEEEGSVIYLHNGPHQMGLVWRIQELSSTQRMVVISGQLVICNKLREAVDIKVHSYTDSRQSEPVCSNPLTLPGLANSPSFPITSIACIELRVRLEDQDFDWSHQIPVTNNSHSELVLLTFSGDLPNQLFSLWFRVVKQAVKGGTRILVMLTPLYKVRSMLPTSTCIKFFMEGSDFEADVVAKGQGATQQLNCLGSTDDTYRMGYRPASGSEPTAIFPWTVAYNLVELPEENKQVSAEDFDSIFQKKHEEEWPYVESDTPMEWVGMDCPNRMIATTLDFSGPLETSLELYLECWALFVNMLDVPVRLVDELEMSPPVPPRGVIVPRIIEEVFHLSVGENQCSELSPPLQLQQKRYLDTASFYMPRISGVIPLDGFLCSTIPTRNAKLMLVTLRYRKDTKKGITVLSVRPTVMLHCAVALSVLAVCVPTHTRALSLPHMPRKALHHATAHTAEPVQAWHCLLPAPNASPQDLAFYLLVQVRKGEWACPLMVPLPSLDKGEGCTSRQCLDVAGEALVLTTHTRAGQVFAVFSKVSQPQLRIINHCRFALKVAQLKLGSRPMVPEEESEHLSWCCQVAPGASVSYNMPTIKSSFPGPAPTWPPLILARAHANPLRWSEAVAVCSMGDHFVSLPGASDVSVQVQPDGGATFNVSVHSVSRIEISAKEIRSRLQPSTLQHSLLPLQAVPCEPIPPVTSCSEEGCVSPQQHKAHTQLAVNVYVSSMEVSLTEDSGFQISELLLLSLDHVFVNVRPSAGGRELQLCVADARLDNQMIYGEGVDFPVVLMRQEPLTPFRINLNDFKDAADGIEPVALLYISLTQEFGADMQAAVSMLRVSMCPISVYVEDALVARCSRLLEQLSPSRLILMPPAPASSATGQLPRQVQWEAREAASPIQIQQLVIEPLSVLVSLRTSRRVFIALDRSPLHFSRFERSRVCTTNYRLGHELTRHYLSGALFRAGWVVGSLELLGSPSAFALTVGSGLRDFVCLPYLGFLQGPWGFLTGITHGSASLMKHLTAGTVSSITNMASSVARNLERCSLDREHVERAEEARRQRPQGVSQGVLQGLSSLGISLLGAVSGIAHHPLQALVHQPTGSSQLSGLVAGVGLGLVGAITKPLSGAAELVALTGQGLLHGTGWSSMPEPRRPRFHNHCLSRNKALLFYTWLMLKEDLGFPLMCIDGKFDRNGQDCVLVLTPRQLFILVPKDQSATQMFPLDSLRAIPVVGSNSKLCFTFKPSLLLPEPQDTPHWRVEDFVRHVGVPHPLEPTVPDEPEGCVGAQSHLPCLHVLIKPALRQYVLNILQMARREALQRGFNALL